MVALASSADFLSDFLLGQFLEAVHTGNQRKAAPIVPGNSQLPGIVHIPNGTPHSGFYRGIGVIHAVQSNSRAEWVTAPGEFHLPSAGKWHIHLGSVLDILINRNILTAPSSGLILTGQYQNQAQLRIFIFHFKNRLGGNGIESQCSPGTVKHNPSFDLFLNYFP